MTKIYGVCKRVYEGDNEYVYPIVELYIDKNKALQHAKEFNIDIGEHLDISEDEIEIANTEFIDNDSELAVDIDEHGLESFLCVVEYTIKE